MKPILNAPAMGLIARELAPPRTNQFRAATTATHTSSSGELAPHSSHGQLRMQSYGLQVPWRKPVFFAPTLTHAGRLLESVPGDH